MARIFTRSALGFQAVDEEEYLGKCALQRHDIVLWHCLEGEYFEEQQQQ